VQVPFINYPILTILPNRMPSWAHVKFLLDDTVVNVPTASFQVIVDGEVADPTELQVQKMYWVFWSQTGGETPTTMKNRGNEIIKIDDLPAKERERRQKSNKGPLAGFYKAVLLDLQNSEGTIV